MLVGVQGSGQVARGHPDPGRVVGTPVACAARLDEYRKAGVSHVSPNPAVGEDGFLDRVSRLRTVAAAAQRAAA